MALINFINCLNTIWEKVFKSGLSKFCGRQPLKIFNGYGLLPLLNILSHVWLQPTLQHDLTISQVRFDNFSS